MGYSATDFQDYASSLFDASNFNDAFACFEAEVSKLGFGGVLYTYIPQVLLQKGMNVNPVYHVSEDYNPAYMDHYTEARFDQKDPLIDAVKDGVDKPISWWGDICTQYMDAAPEAYEVIETARHYGINNGVTLPLMSGHAGISGASFISDETTKFGKLLDSRIDDLQLCTKLFHNMVLSNAPYRSEFVKPLVDNLSETEIKFLVGLVNGKAPGQIACELGLSNGYLEQVMIKLRRKVSGVDPEDSPTINRNQLLYYAGLLEIMQYSDDE